MASAWWWACSRPRCSPRSSLGAAAGGLVGKFAKHQVDSGIEQGLGDKLAPGTAAIIAVVDGEDRLAAEQALAGSLAKSVAAMGKKGLGELKDALAEAAGKFSPDRTVLPIPDRSFGGTIGRTIDQSVADWTMIPGPQAPDERPERPGRHHRRRGVRQPRHVRRADQHPEPDAGAADGHHLQPAST